MSEALLIYTTWPDLESAHAFGSKAVHAGLAACANILGPMRSIYRWEGAVEQADETPLLLKTTRRQLEDLRAAFLSSHPYDTPAFVASGRCMSHSKTFDVSRATTQIVHSRSAASRVPS